MQRTEHRIVVPSFWRGLAVALSALAIAWFLMGCASSWNATMQPGGAMTAGENHSTAWPIGESAVTFTRIVDGDKTTETMTMQRTKGVAESLGLAAIPLIGAAVASGGAVAP